MERANLGSSRANQFFINPGNLDRVGLGIYLSADSFRERVIDRMRITKRKAQGLAFELSAITNTINFQNPGKAGGYTIYHICNQRTGQALQCGPVSLLGRRDKNLVCFYLDLNLVMYSPLEFTFGTFDLDVLTIERDLDT